MSIFAPAKVNLFLHITGRRADGHHTLESLVAFAQDIGDTLNVGGGPLPDDNLITRMTVALGHDVSFSLAKDLPIAGGLGGGSADAAAAARMLVERFAAPPDLEEILLRLGSDLPVCFYGRPTYVRGVGEDLTFLNYFPRVPIVLVNAGVACPTAQVFALVKGPFTPPHSALPAGVKNFAELADLLHHTTNDLEKAALKVVPEIAQTLEALRGTGAVVARMSGSGASCFGLFATSAQAVHAAQTLQHYEPSWWVRAGHLASSNV